MKQLIKLTLISIALLGLTIISCQKNDLSTASGNYGQTSLLKESPLPPLREFECGTPSNNPQNPCPNASCPYLGWNCADEVDIKSSGSYNTKSTEGYSMEEYKEAVKMLDKYILQNNTAEFFTLYTDMAFKLMNELKDSGRLPILNDLKSGKVSVIKHSVYSDVYSDTLSIYQLYIVSTGQSPDYGDIN